MNRICSWKLLVLVFLLFVGGCTASQAPAATAQLPADIPPDLARRWLRGIPCELPCWEGITPGVTTIEEAVQILRHHPAVVPGSVLLSRVEDSPNAHLLWNWKGASVAEQPAITYRLEFFHEREVKPHIVSTITPRYYNVPGLVYTFTLGELVQVLGEPSHINAVEFYSHGSRNYSLTIIYREKGLLVRPIGVSEQKPDLSLDLVLESVEFRARPLVEEILGVPWRGLLSFDEYCRPLEAWRRACGKQ